MYASLEHVRQDDRLLDLIYDAAFDPQLWAPVLEQVADRARAHPGNLLQINVVDGQGIGMSARVPEDTVSRYFSTWSSRNPIGLVDDPSEYRTGWLPKITRDSDSVDRNSLERSDYWNEFLVPLGAHHSITLRLALRKNDLTSIGFGRPARYGPFEDEEIAALRPLHPHLIRAERMWRKFGLRQAELDQLDVLVENSPDALFFLDDRFSLLRWTKAADEFLRRGALRTVGKTLHVPNAASDAVLQGAFMAALAGHAPSPVALPATQAADPLTVSVARLGERALAAFSGARCLLVTVRTSAQPGSPASLRTTFGLTAAEVELALALAAGESLRKVAVRRGVSINTIRNQLGAVFDKTNCRRQQDLVRLLTIRRA